MAADEAVLMWSRQSAAITSTDQIQKRASVIESYTVVTAPEDDVVDALAAPGLPVIGSTVYPGTILLCTRRTPRRMSPIFWIIEIEYSGETGVTDPSEHPTQQKGKIRWQAVTSTEAIDEDADGNPIATVLGEPITGVTMPRSDFKLSVEKNYLGVNLAATAQYLLSTNSDIYFGFAPGTAHLEAFNATEMIEENNAQGYWKVNAEIMFRTPYNTTPDKAWWQRVKHEGYRVKTTDGRTVAACDDNQAEVTKPVLLKEDGTKEDNPANTHWLEFKRFPYSLSYTALGLYP